MADSSLEIQIALKTNPENDFTVSDIARLTGLSYNTVDRHARMLALRGAISFRVRNAKPVYRHNPQW